MTLPSIAYLRTRLSYDKETGSLVWLPRPSSDFTKKHHFASWVSRCEGKEAGVIVTKKRKSTAESTFAARKSMRTV
ncbi:hypothetical protein P4197_01125 [Pseudomonas aeruginosa]|nr:hypothetical protein [Pseudomonas aeruginosa]MDF5923123.1 hypothetical protein [Pseudomonas aeruginosa]